MDSTQGVSIVHKLDSAKLITGNYGILIKDVVIQCEGTGQLENTSLMKCLGGQASDTAEGFQFENVSFVNKGTDSKGDSVINKSVALLIDSSAGYGTLQNCVFRNFYSPYLMRNDGAGSFAWRVADCDFSNCQNGLIYLKSSIDSGWTRVTNSNFGTGRNTIDTLTSADTSKNFFILGCGATTSSLAKIMAVSAQASSNGAKLIKTKGQADSLIGAGNNLFFVTPQYVDPLHNDFRLITGSPLIDADKDGYTDISSVQRNTVITSSNFLNVTVTLPGNLVVSYVNGTTSIDPGIPKGAVEIIKKTTNDLRPVSQIILKQNMSGKTLNVKLAIKKGSTIPSLPANYVISDVAANGHPILAFRFSELPAVGAFSQKSTTIDSIPPAMPGNFSAAIDNNNVVLHWKQNTEPDFMRYTIYRTTNETIQIASLEKSTTGFIDIGAAGTSAIYSIAAYDSIGNESVQNQVQSANFIYVADNGSDTTGNGSITKPYRTITKAVSRLPDTPKTSYVISIFPGEYDEQVALKNASREPACRNRGEGRWTATKPLIFRPQYDAPDSMPLWRGSELSAPTPSGERCGVPFIPCNVAKGKNECLSIENEDYVTVEGIWFAELSEPFQADGKHPVSDTRRRKSENERRNSAP